MLERLESILSYRVEKDALANHFVVSLKDSESMIHYQAEMLENNETAGILKFDSKNRNGETELWYDISLYDELTRYVAENKISGKQFMDFLETVVNTIQSSSKLFLDETHFVLDTDKIFVGKNMTPFLIYLPVQNAGCDLKAEFKALFEYLSSHVEISPGVGDAIHILQKEINNSSMNFKSFAEKLGQVKRQNHGNAPEKQAAVPQPIPYMPEPVRPAAQQRTPELLKSAEPIEIKQKGKENKDLLAKKAGGKDPDKKSGKDQEKKSGKDQEKKSGSNNTLRIALIQILAALGVVYLFTSGTMKNFEATQAAGIVMMILIADFLVTRKVLGMETQPPQKKDNGKGKKEKSDKSNDFRIDKQQKIQSSGAIDRRTPVNVPEETVIDLSGDDSTVVLETAVNNAYLVNNEGGIDTRISVSSNPFVMGKSHQGVDMVCASKHVSRQHAQIIREDGQYYIVDLNSTNGSFLNGTRLEPNMKYPVSSGDTISLAKDNYTFYLQ